MANRRLTRPRSRNGCITCKLRHVKCDEAKPECMQCQRSGRKCDGYDSASQTQLRQRIAERHRPLDRDMVGADHRLLLRQETGTERRYVEFFYGQSSSAFSGFYNSKLWSYLIPQLGEHEPSIRHAMTAIGAIHSRLQNPKLLTAGENSAPTDWFVIEEYNKSIQALTKSLSSANAGIDLTLTTCCLFVCLEMLQGNRRAALDHIEAGLQIIQRHDQSSPVNARQSEVYIELRSLFMRLNLQASFMGRLLVPLRHSPADIVRPGIPFTSLLQARSHLDQIMLKTLLFIRSVGIMREARDPAEQAAFEEKQEAARLEFTSWRWSLDKFLQRHGHTLTPSEICASLLLKIYYHTSLFWTLSVLCRSEDVFDDFITDFESVVSHAEEIVRITSTTPSSSAAAAASTIYPVTPPDNQPPHSNTVFSLEGGIIGPLYYTACRCRDPFIRRRAISTMLHYSKREGMWDARLYAAVANLVCEVEESKCLIPPTCAADIGSLDRVYEEVQPKELKSRPTFVVLYMKPQGVDGPWKMSSVMVDW
ncbi:hypothetical protein BJY01DRAFT_228999 [Aspergillus pseudoustus]|uniref:Zn(2)-C6 fungal-type domain-containing protein n=1 Tax=Aspergillus pseudoustus TaxID=1810923 RepID=A0ABR4IJB5_9EURO